MDYFFPQADWLIQVQYRMLIGKNDLNDDLNDTDSWRLSISISLKFIYGIIDAIQQQVYFITQILIRSLLSAIFVLGVPDPTLEKVGSENSVRERRHVTVRVFVLDVRNRCSRVGSTRVLPRTAIRPL
jgi:hypothetical protein